MSKEHIKARPDMPRQAPTRAGQLGTASNMYRCAPKVEKMAPAPSPRMCRPPVVREKPVKMPRPDVPMQSPTMAGKKGLAGNLYGCGCAPIPLPACPPPAPAPSPLLRYMHDHSSRVVAGDNVEVIEVRTPAASTYVVSSKTSPDTDKRIKELEESVAKELAEIARIKATMLTVEEDPTEDGNGILFKQGME